METFHERDLLAGAAAPVDADGKALAFRRERVRFLLLQGLIFEIGVRGVHDPEPAFPVLLCHLG